MYHSNADSPPQFILKEQRAPIIFLEIDFARGMKQQKLFVVLYGDRLYILIANSSSSIDSLSRTKMIPISVPYLKLHSSFRAIIRKLGFISWISYNICFCKAALILLGKFCFLSATKLLAYYLFDSHSNYIDQFAGLIFSHKLVDIAVVAVLITYLTDYPRNYNVVEAARLVNLQEGISASTVIFLTCIPDAFSGRLNVIFYSTISCILVSY